MADAAALRTAERAARAKLNLFLHVLGRRADGYHELDSLVVFADVADRVRVAPATDLSLRIDGGFAADVPADERNLVWRAAVLLAEAADVPARAAIALHKKLPVAAGLGGGSADAAACLQALCEIWGLEAREIEARDDRLQRIGARLGADVPACLAGVPVAVSGIGECLAPVPGMPELAAVLVNPGVPLGTAAVFAAFDRGAGAAAASAGSETGAGALAARLAGSRNDLEPAAINLAPPVATVLAALRKQRGCQLARMSGSGATCFGLFAGSATAAAAARSIAVNQPGWWVRPARIDGSP